MGHYKLGKLADDFIERSRADGQVFRERLPLPDLRSVGGELSAQGIRQLRRDRCHSAGKCCRDGTREPIILKTKRIGEQPDVVKILQDRKSTRMNSSH